jgi:hypothetical protein
MIRKKILIIAFYKKWRGISRLPQALDRAGFEVYALCPFDSYLAKTKYLKRKILYPAFFYSRSKIMYLWMAFAIMFLKPELIIPADEDTIFALLKLSSAFQNIPLLSKISLLINQSMTSAKMNSTLLSKSSFQALCAENGIRAPRNIYVGCVEDALHSVLDIGYPLVVKHDISYGGSGVAICNDQQCLINYFNEISRINNILKIKKILKRLFFISALVDENKISLQQYITGQFGQAPFVAMNGNLISYNMMISLETYPDFKGETTVSSGVENSEIYNFINTVVHRLQYTGFGSLEFILEAKSGLPYLIELNPRPTPTCHLTSELVTNDLCKDFYKYLHDIPVKLNSFQPFIVAMYPGELIRDPDSQYLSKGFHDIPRDDYELLKALEMG